MRTIKVLNWAWVSPLPRKKLIAGLLKKAAKTNYVHQELVTFPLPFWGHALCILIVIAVYDATGDDKHVRLARP